MDEILAQTGMMGFVMLAGPDPDAIPLTPNDLLTMWSVYNPFAQRESTLINIVQLSNWTDRTRTDL